MTADDVGVAVSVKSTSELGLEDSPLGNPYAIPPKQGRSDVIAKCRAWLWDQYKNHPLDYPARELARLSKIHTELGGLDLICWCAPKSCHADIIRNCLLWMERTDKPKLATPPDIPTDLKAAVL